MYWTRNIKFLTECEEVPNVLTQFFVGEKFFEKSEEFDEKENARGEQWWGKFWTKERKSFEIVQKIWRWLYFNNAFNLFFKESNSQNPLIENLSKF